MESSGDLVISFAEQFVFDQPPAIRFVEGDRPTMYYRRRQIFVARMLHLNVIVFGREFPRQHARGRIAFDGKRRLLIYRALLRVIDLDRGMIRGRSEKMTRMQIGGVNVGAGIDYE